jgi:hypothetical protein
LFHPIQENFNSRKRDFGIWIVIFVQYVFEESVMPISQKYTARIQKGSHFPLQETTGVSKEGILRICE